MHGYNEIRYYRKQFNPAKSFLDITYALQTLPELHGQIWTLHDPKWKPKQHQLSNSKRHA